MFSVRFPLHETDSFSRKIHTLTGDRVNKREMWLPLNFIVQSLIVGVKFISLPKPKENP